MMPTTLNNWAYETVPQPGLNGRRGYQPRGKVLGGSSSINAMLYVRGHPSDYDDWAELGAEGGLEAPEPLDDEIRVLAVQDHESHGGVERLGHGRGAW